MTTANHVRKLADEIERLLARDECYEISAAKYRHELYTLASKIELLQKDNKRLRAEVRSWKDERNYEHEKRKELLGQILDGRFNRKP